jgi:hypothetical protein
MEKNKDLKVDHTMPPTVNDKTLNRQLAMVCKDQVRGVKAAMRKGMREYMRKTLDKSRVLAKYVRNSPGGKFTATDVAVVDYIRGISTDDQIKLQLKNKRHYSNFLQRAPERRKRAKKEMRWDASADYDLGGDEWDAKSNESLGKSRSNDGKTTQSKQGAMPARSNSSSLKTMKDDVASSVDLKKAYVKVPINPYGDCLFNCIGLASRYVESGGSMGAHDAASRQDREGLRARREIVEFLRTHKQKLAKRYSAGNNTWDEVVALHGLESEEFKKAYPDTRQQTFDNYMKFLSKTGSWGAISELYAANEAYPQPLFSFEYLSSGPSWEPLVDFHTETHNGSRLPVVEVDSKYGIHYTLWLPKKKPDPGTFYDLKTFNEKYTKVNIHGRGNCFFNCLGVAHAFVKGGGKLTVNEASRMQDDLGKSARTRTVSYLRSLDIDKVRLPTNNEWTVRRLFEGEVKDADVGFKREYPQRSRRNWSKYLEYMGKDQNWATTIEVVFANSIFKEPVVSEVVMREDDGMRITDTLTKTALLPVIEKSSVSGNHYTLWLPKQVPGSPNVRTPEQHARRPTASSPSMNGSGARKGLSFGSGTPQSGRKKPQTNSAQSPQSGSKKPHPVQEKSRRSVKIPARFKDYVMKLDLRRLKGTLQKHYSKRRIEANYNNLFKAVAVAAGIESTQNALQILRNKCAKLIVKPSFRDLAVSYLGTWKNVQLHAIGIGEKKKQGGEVDLFILAHILKRCIVVTDGRRLLQYKSPGAPSAWSATTPIYLDVRKYYDAFVPKK